MSGTQTYETFRDFVDSWGLAMMMLVFLVLVAWPWLPGSKQANEDARTIIFRDDDHV